MQRFLERDYWIGFSVFPGIGPVRFSLLLNVFGSAEKAWNAKKDELIASGLSLAITERFIDFRNTFSFESYTRDLDKKSVRTVCRFEKEYPLRLLALSDAPIVLYVVGGSNLSVLHSEKMIGIVGTRKMNEYGKVATQKISAELVGQGWVIVSGLALGVDGVAHETVLDLKGKTIAVLGCGVDVIAPVSHTRLYHRIAEHGGCILSEMPLGHMPLRGLFPARNRIISGLSLGVVVTQGAHNSGAMITAKYAGEQGREVFAIPGDIRSPLSEGPHILLKNGASLVSSSQDIIETFGYTLSKQQDTISFNLTDYLPDEQLVLKMLMQGSYDSDMLVQTVHLSVSVVSSILTQLEMKGIITRDEQGLYHLH